MEANLTRTLAAAMREAVVDVQAKPVILGCRWCGKRSNPRRDVETALRDLDGHPPPPHGTPRGPLVGAS